jgi:hypothetical protein
MFLINKQEGPSPGPKHAFSCSFELPLSAAHQTAISKRMPFLFFELLGKDSIWLEMTHWTNDSDSNIDLFYGYRKSHGDARTIREASLYKFEPMDSDAMASIIGMVLYFNWDATLFDEQKTFKLMLSHDRALDFTSSAEREVRRLIDDMRLLKLVQR